MTGYEKRTTEKKDAILRSARELFSARGMQDVGINEIAKKAKVSQVSIYNYFGDKKNLAKEAFISYVEVAMERFEQILQGDLPFSEKLEQIMQGKSDMVSQIALSHFNEKALDDKILRQVFQEALMERATVLYTNFIELGKKENAIDSTIPTPALISYLMMSMSILNNAEFISSNSEYKMGMIKLFLYGIIGTGNDNKLA